MSTHTGTRSPKNVPKNVHSNAYFDVENENVVAVRRNVLLSGVVGGLAMLLGLGYLIRGASAFDVLLGLLLVMIAVLHLPALASAKLPVIVADDQGLRLRMGYTWRGLPWASMQQVVVEYADSPLREGRMVVLLRDPERMLENVGQLAHAHLRWNRFWYGASLAIPLGMTTVSEGTELAEDLDRLAAGRTEVVNLRGRQPSRLDEVAPDVQDEEPAYDWSSLTESVVIADPEAEPEVLDELDEPAAADDATTYADPVDWEPTDADVPVEDAVPEDDSSEDGAPEVGPSEEESPEEPKDELPAPPEPPLPAPVSPLRDLNRPARVDIRLDNPAPEAAEPEPEAAEAEAPTASVPTQRTADQPAGSLELEDYPVEVEVLIDDFADPLVPASVPVIGPKILHAREMLDMSIEELSQRTRIRPHVLEAIEVDDFGPCGGDFYARGHLTAVARVLGLTLESLMKSYDEQYAQAPINPRRVFEADQSSGLSGGMRTSFGGPRWSLVIGAVLCLTMIWGLARMFAGDPEKLTAAPGTSSQTAGLAANQRPITSTRMKTTVMTVAATHAGTRAVVRDRTGKVLWSGDLALGKHRTIVGLAPFKVTAENAGAVEVTVKGKALGTIGTAGTAGTKTFG